MSPLRLFVCALVLAQLAGCGGAGRGAAGNGGRVAAHVTAGELEREVFEAVNDYRRSRGLGRLALDAAMSDEARGHSRWMAARGQLSHRGTRERFRRLQGPPSALGSFAENLAFNFNHPQPAASAVRGWIRSPGHHRNMLGREFDRCGVGVARAADGRWYFTQLFGRRLGAAGG